MAEEEQGIGPAEAVRRALRAARVRPEEPAPAPAEPSAPPPDRPQEVTPESDGTSSRPGDAARAALRRTAEAPPAHEEAPPADVPAAAEVPPTGDVPAAGDEPRGTSGVRPGDVAREALRAARAQARQAEPETGEPGDGRRARHTSRAGARPVASGSAGRPGDRVADARVRDVRTFLADAFRMPPETDTPDTTGNPDTTGTTEAAEPVEPAVPEPAVPEPTPAARSMAAPTRDGDHRRTYPAFPPRPADAGGGFAETWWGNAWVTALEEGALDAKRLARGRGYAEQGHVDAITVTPGLVLAYVQGSRARPYRVQVRLRTLGDEDWERFLDAAVERPGHIAALLDKEMPESLADCGVPLLPGPGDLAPQCSCPDHGHPCKHVAALCYQAARLLDADPFVLLLLRGRGERELLDALSRRNAARAARAAQEQEPEPVPGIRATDALAARRLPPLPAPLPAPQHPEQPPAYPSVPNGPDSFALDQLATDAAVRAHALLTTGHDEIGELTLWQDAVRLAAARPGSGLTATSRALYASLASAAGRTPAELARAVAAWRQGGPDGLAVLEDLWDPPAGRFDRARPLLRAADLPAFRPWRNHLTHPRGHVQLRFGRDGLWYPYESEPGHDDWWPRGTPDTDPVGALTGLGSSADDL
ncbi:SWIM zinc finger family protein [Streptomyces sp. NPDC058335]|uniref:SWIM zinc finger family protein n=1 Tax=Streptomyces sp. NPDC058335 TaxID=3346451 RepID=UPI003663825A